MKEYNVKWNGFETSANSPLDAAKEALDGIKNGIARTFLVQDQKTGECFSIDLDEENEDAVQSITKEQFERDDYSVQPK